MNKTIVCIGAALVDELYFCESAIVAASSNPAHKETTIGGVISNIVQHLALLATRPALITAIGPDAEGVYMQDCFLKLGIDFSQAVITTEATGKYVSVLNSDGNLYVAVCEDKCSKYISAAYLEDRAAYINRFDMIIVDANLAVETLQWIIRFAQSHGKQLIIEPVSVAKAHKLAALDLTGVFMLTPNEEELMAICSKEVVEAQSFKALFDRGINTIWLRKGAKGSEVVTATASLTLEVPTITITDSTGAGDAALAGWVFGYVNGETPKTCLQLGHTLALEILQQKGAVVSSITAAQLYKLKKKYYNE